VSAGTSAAASARAGCDVAPMTRPPAIVLERVGILTSADEHAVVALETATQDRPLALATLLREAEKDGVVLLARLEDRSGRVVGFASARLLHDEVHIIRLAVEDAHRRSGIATRLLDALLDWADGTGAVAVLLEVRAGNDGARTLYTKAGFVADGVRPRYYPDGEDALLLRRDRIEPRADRPAEGI
jgi:ribosomal-protein-alanine N-acetyltransferase